MSQECNSPFYSLCKLLIKTAKQISINTTGKKRVPWVRKFLKFKVIGPECVKILLNKVTKFYSCLFTPPHPLPCKVFWASSWLLFNKSLLNLAAWLIWRHSSSHVYRFSLTGQQCKVETNFWFWKLESCLNSTFRIVPTIAVMMKEPGLETKQNLFIELLAPRPKRHSVVPNRNDWLSNYGRCHLKWVRVCVCLFFSVFCLVHSA